MKTKIAICGAEFFAYHGYYPEERKSGHTFIIDAEVTLKSTKSMRDNIANTVNYEDMYRICTEEMKATKELIESVAESIINRFFKEFPNITNAKIQLRKLSPQLGGKVNYSLIEVEM